MFRKNVFLFFLLICIHAVSASQNPIEKKMNLEKVRTLIDQNRSVIIETLNKQIATDNLEQRKSERLPEILMGGNGYLGNKIPLSTNYKSDNNFLYHFNLASEVDVYTGGLHKYGIERMRKEQELSDRQLKSVQQDVELQAYILLYDIHRNIKYKDFIRSSIHLREKEYERIEQLYKNGVVLKSDLLRSKLYITDLQKDEVEIKNSIDILSDKLRVLLGIQENISITPELEKDLDYAVNDSFEDLYQCTLQNSPILQMHHIRHNCEEIALKEIHSAKLPHLKLYAQYGVGSAQPVLDYNHQLGGEVGVKLSLSLSSFYKTKNKIQAQRQRISREQYELTDKEEKLRNSLYAVYTRYHESLLNINRAIEKIAMSKETTRILRNSYFNQQALLIDVLESETQLMEASFEWVEAVVDSQKYYWALKKISGIL